MNLLMRRTAAATFLLFTFFKVNVIYFLIHFDNILVEIMLFDVTITILSFGFVLSYLFTQQIKSAHQSYKFINSFVCNYKIRLRIKLKVNLLIC